MKRKAKRTIPTSPKEVRRSSRKPAFFHDGIVTIMPPNRDVLQIYFDQKGEGKLDDDFFNEHDARGWKPPTGGIIYNWKVCAAEWIFNRR